MKRRDFLKLLPAGVLGLAAVGDGPGSAAGHAPSTRPGPGAATGLGPHWIWSGPNLHESADGWRREFARMKAAGIGAVLLTVYNGHRAFFRSRIAAMAAPRLEELLPLARAAGLAVHGWMWTLPCNDPAIQERHPDWYVVNGRGESARTHPAYVPYYRFLCPNRAGVREHIRRIVADLSAVEGLAGVHLDYIRYPDVILPVGLQPKYGIVQDREYPQYDYCYCEVCRRKFREATGMTVDDLPRADVRAAWDRFRYDSITGLVNDVLAPAVRQRGKQLTAAVFPNWRNVRQEWSRWRVDAVLPMLYHGFYNAGLDWVTARTRAGIGSLKPGVELYSGLYVPHLAPEDVPAALCAAREGGAAGVSLFDVRAMSEEHWRHFAAAARAWGGETANGRTREPAK